MVKNEKNLLCQQQEGKMESIISLTEDSEI